MGITVDMIEASSVSCLGSVLGLSVLQLWVDGRRVRDVYDSLLNWGFPRLKHIVQKLGFQSTRN